MYTVPLIINNEITNLSLAQTMLKNMTDMFAVTKIVFYYLYLHQVILIHVTSITIY